uniref:HAT C-terminal dimerisation domain-containing protein n=1 Tax=Fusarium oxysporum (strain Fo5176) TaxID=660025 RepID=A0A0D2YDU1_FUSOF
MRSLVEQDLDHWRTKGPIGKLRNIVKFIRSSPQRSEQFKRVAREQDHEGYQLCEESTAEVEVVMNNETREVTEETMGKTQVDAAERIATVSANFRVSNGRPSRVHRLPARFEEDEVYALPQRSQPPRFVESALPLHSRADYSTAEKRSASETSQKEHITSGPSSLHPGINQQRWLEATWVSEEQLACVRDAKAGIKGYFTRWYDANQGLCEETTKYDAALRTMGQEDDQYTQWINSKTKKAFVMGGSVGELERYLRLEPQDTQDAIQWWRDHRASFPSLSSFALDVFAIPAMASDCERQFSLAKLTLTSQRLSMGADTLEHFNASRTGSGRVE